MLLTSGYLDYSFFLVGNEGGNDAFELGYGGVFARGHYSNAGAGPSEGLGLLLQGEAEEMDGVFSPATGVA